MRYVRGIQNYTKTIQKISFRHIEILRAAGRPEPKRYLPRVCLSEFFDTFYCIRILYFNSIGQTNIASFCIENSSTQYSTCIRPSRPVARSEYRNTPASRTRRPASRRLPAASAAPHRIAKRKPQAKHNERQERNISKQNEATPMKQHCA